MLEELTESRKALASSYHMVVLLLNLEEKDHLALKKSMQSIQQGLKNFDSFSDVQVKLDLIEDATAVVIKQEWRVIKAGGKTGQSWLTRSRWLIGVAFIVGVFLISSALFFSFSNDGIPLTTTLRCTNSGLTSYAP